MGVVRAPTAVDLFSGAGGTTQGLRDAGFEVLAAIENDPSSVDTFVANHPATLVVDRDIQRVQAPAFARRLGLSDERRLDILTACPPCQPFSTLGSGDANDPRNALVSVLKRFIVALRPRAVILENVPGLRNEPRFRQLLRAIGDCYDVREYVVQAAGFGVPQSRRRMIVLCVERDIGTKLPDDLLDALPDDFDRATKTAGDAIALAENLSEDEDPVHRARSRQPKTLKRIKAVKPGEGRLHLPARLRLECHKELKQRNATSIYGRIDPALPAPTMTTRCTTPSCGRFIHPTEHRGLTLREAALLQSFPVTYSFCGTYGEIECQIGNAVPPKLSEALGLIVAGLLDLPTVVADAARAQAA
jgi:DNA (cytosine-5)-methyltransferase 1